MRLSVEDWEMLTDEEKEARKDEMPESLFEPKEDMAIIDGKPRPLKAVMEEMRRKVTEDIRRDLASNPSPNPSHNRPADADILAQIHKSAEDELVNKGRTVPIETILNLINRGVSNYITNVQNVQKVSTKVIKMVKRELRQKYTDFNEYEDEFDDAIDEVHPTRVTDESLRLLFDAIRGRHVDEKIKEAENRGREMGNGKIIGAQESGSSFTPKSSKSKLTSEQQKEANELGLEDDSYLSRLKNRQKHAKEMGATILPQTMGEPIRRPL